jgi:hypothetical protein
MCAAASTGKGDAQTLAGRLLDETTSAPVVAAFATLLDQNGATAGAALSAADGRFNINAPTGLYSLRVERLGIASYESEPFRLDGDSTSMRDFRVQARPVVLPAIEVDAESRCDGPRELAAGAVMLWEEARKALAVASWTASSDRIVYHVTQYKRTFDVGMRLTQEDSQSVTVRAPRGPFASIPVDSLLSRGFVQPAPEGRGWLYFGPDADVLLSDAFLDHYCFRAAPNSIEEDLVGLDFEPAGPEEVPGIEGTLWLDRGTFELRSIEYSFTRVPYRVATPAGGRIGFEALPDGGWIIDYWSMRVPVLRDSGRVPIRTVTLEGYIETVRQLTGAFRSDGSEIPLGR